MRLFLFLASFWILVSCSYKSSEKTFVDISKRVYDGACLLDESERQGLKFKMDSISFEVGVDIFVLTMTELPIGQTIDTYANQFANSILPDGNGILILIVFSDRTSRIEVGVGLENVLEDQIAAQFLRDYLGPNFKEKRYFDGFSELLCHIRDLLIERRKIIGTRPYYIDRWDSIRENINN